MEMKENKVKKDKIKLSIISFILIITDQIIKYFIRLQANFMPIDMIKNIIKINYVENFGIAFGIAEGGRFIFIFINFIVMGIILKFLFTQWTNLDKIKKIFIMLIISGGIGNLIDRIFRGYVIDYIDCTQIINFPVFNLADIMIVIGAIVVAISIIRDMLNENKKSKNSI